MTNDQLREITGRVTSADPFVNFFYTLLRDHLPVGTAWKLVFTITSENTDNPEGIVFTDGNLANTAKLMIEALQEAVPQD